MLVDLEWGDDKNNIDDDIRQKVMKIVKLLVKAMKL